MARTLERYPGDLDLARLVRASSPQVIFLSVESLGEALAVAKSVEAHTPGLPIAAVHRTCDPSILIEVMRAGVREFLYPPFSPASLAEVLLRIRAVVERRPPPVESSGLVFAFLPSKAGVGTSTIALNTAAALADLQNADVLLADFDLNSGMIGFMLKLQSPYSVVHAAENHARLDENLWPQLVSRADCLHVLPSGKLNPGFRIEPAQIRNLMDFARRHYRAICVDLSGNMEKYSIELLHEAKRIFLVCTQELPSLHLARQKLSYLRTLELEERVSIVINRVQKRTVIGIGEIEQLLGLRVEVAFPNDYAGVHRALAEGKRIDSSSELGGRFRTMAENILARKPLNVGHKRRFVEYFSILPARYSLFPTGKKSAT